MGGQLANRVELNNYYADKWGIPRNVFFNLIQLESSWNPDAISPSGKHFGLGQLGPGVRKDYNVSNPFDANENLDAAGHYLRDLFDTFKSLKLAIAAYHSGEKTVRDAGNVVPGSVDKYTGLPTKTYVDRILGNTPDVYTDNPVKPATKKTAIGKLKVNPNFQKALILGTASVLLLYGISRYR